MGSHIDCSGVTKARMRSKAHFRSTDLGISLSRNYRLRLAWPSIFRFRIVLLIRNLHVTSLPPHRDSGPPPLHLPPPHRPSLFTTATDSHPPSLRFYCTLNHRVSDVLQASDHRPPPTLANSDPSHRNPRKSESKTSINSLMSRR